MNTYEPKNKNFIIMILFIVVMVSSAKTLHDITVADSDQSETELIAEETVTVKK